MALRIYNTLTRRTEEFRPLRTGYVSFYQCGPTVYWTQHIGNLRAMVMADVLRRSLEYLGFRVKFVRNYTDVGHLVSDEAAGEDKMENAARREGSTPQMIAQKYIDIFERDTAALNVRVPDARPRATDHIEEILQMVQTLVEKGFAYETSRAIYFDVSKAREYARLSRQKPDGLRHGAGTGDGADPEKRDPRDFALWFFKKGAHKDVLQAWQSPWGIGFPGWHIECSAMTKKHLGLTIDIHMGGVEHIPVHHTNEIAQSESANGVPLARYWLHNEHLTVDGAKMAKSEGTSYSLTDVTERGFDPLALRYFFLQAHYRSKQNFTWDALEAAARGLARIRDRVTHLELGNSVSKDFVSALEDDFNIPQALAVLEEALKAGDRMAALDFDRVLGLSLDTPAEHKPVPVEVIRLAEAREEARKAKNWSEADRLRKEIEESGFEIRDAEAGYTIHRLSTGGSKKAE